VGDGFEVTDGHGNLARAELTSDDKRKAGFRIIESHKIPKRTFSIHLAIAPTKNIDRMEWLVEKCTEIGIDKITFVRCKTSERPSVLLERLQKLVLSAMKQSKQAWLPEVRDIVAFKDFLSTVTEEQCFIAYVDNTNPDQLFAVAKPGKNSVLMIGPEGDFTTEELSLAIAAGFRKVSLGPNRLRTETAGLHGVSTLNLRNAGA
jgi:16S rRNA (uracil1498-N3)-methyltransferase